MGSQKPMPPDKQTLSIQGRVRFCAERNFLKYPFFDTCRQSTRGMIRIEEMVHTKEGTVELLWEVSRHLDRKFPGELAAKIHRQVVERIVSETRKPISGLIRLGSYRDICNMLGTKYTGKMAAAIKEALRDVQFTGIRAKWTFYLKKKKSYIDDSFHLYDRIIFTGQYLPNGEIADAIYIVLGSWYVESVNANYVVPLDFDYHKGLKGTITTRMYEWLSLNFFAALDNGRSIIRPRYSTLCRDFPLVKQNSRWKAKKQLSDAHRQHAASGYIVGEPEWVSIPNERNDWLIVYRIGERAKQEYERNKERAAGQVVEIPYYEMPFLENVGPLALPMSEPEALTDASAGETEPQSSVEEEQTSIESDAHDLVCYFQQKKNNRKGYEPKKTEVDQAIELIKRCNRNMDLARYVVSNAIAEMGKTKFDAQWFGAIRGYVADGLATYDKYLIEKERAAKKRAEIEKWERMEKAKRDAFTKEVEEKAQLAEKVKATLSEEDFQRIEQEAIRRLPDIYREAAEEMKKEGYEERSTGLEVMTKQALDMEIANVIFERTSGGEKPIDLTFGD